MRVFFFLTFLGVISFISIFVAYTVVIKDEPDDQMINLARELAIVNIVIAGSIFLFVAESSRRVTYALAKVYSKLHVRQKATVRGSLFISFTVSAYVILIIVDSSFLLSENCPLFTDQIIYVAMVQTFFGNLLIFLFHMVAIQHTLCSDCPELLVTERPGIRGWLPFLPSFLLVVANCTLSYVQQFQIYINNNAYSVDATRLQACDDINSGRPFVCTAFDSYTASSFQVSDGIYITASLLYAWLVILVSIAWRRLSVVRYFEHRYLNISLRLYIWQTGLVYTCIYIHGIVNLAEEDSSCR